MKLIVASLVVLAFVAACHALSMVTAARQVVATARGGMAALRDAALDDEAKERAAQRAAVALFGGFLSITLRSLVALLVSAAVIYAADLAGLVPASATIARLASWEFLIAATLAVSVGYFIVTRRSLEAVRRRR